MTDVDEPERVARKPGPLRSISLVWAVPVLALLVALAIAWQTYANRGPEIVIAFEDASGVEPGKTPIRYRNVVIGRVDGVGFSADADQVLVEAELQPDMARFLNDTTRFWVVQPEVSTQGITGLETVISGVYIEMDWREDDGTYQESFEGLAQAPATPASVRGTRIRLSAPDGGALARGSPVFFKKIQVGTVESRELTEAGDAVVFDVFVRAPHDRRLTTATRFYNTSGFSFGFGPEGASFDVESLAALVQGGVTFDQFGSGGEPIEEDRLFRLFSSVSEARDSTVLETPGDGLLLTAAFDGSVRGLRPGAAVEYRGIRVGEVVSIDAVVEDDASGIPGVQLVTTLSLRPARIGIMTEVEEEALDLLAAQVERGLRAQLASASLISATLFVDLIETGEDDGRALGRDADPHPRIPTVPSDIEGFTASAEGVLDRINQLPIEEILGAATDLLNNVNAIVASEGVREAPAEVTALIRDVRTLVASPELQSAPEVLGAALEEVRRMLENVETTDTFASLTTTLENAEGASASLAAAADQLPQLLTSAERLLAGAETLPAETEALIRTLRTLASDPAVAQVPEEAAATLAELRGLLATEEVRAIPGEAQAVLAGLSAILAEAERAGTVAQLNATLAETERAVARFAEAGEGLPALTAQVERLLAEAEGLPDQTERLLGAISDIVESDAARDLPAEANALLAEIRALLGSAEVRQVPVELSATLAELRATLEEARRAELVATLQRALDEAAAAAVTLNQSASEVPGLIADARAVVAGAAAVELDGVARSVQRLVDDADRLLASQGVQELPVALGLALDEVRLALAELRAAGTAETATETLDAIAAAARGLPPLLARLTETATRAEGVLAGFEVGSELNYEAVAALREVREAARALTQLADTVERQPNAILIGK